MGASTFLVGCLPSYESIGFIAPVVLIALRMAQGLLRRRIRRRGDSRRRARASGPTRLLHELIQTTATLGLLLSLIVIMFTQIYVNANYPEVTTAAGTRITRSQPGAGASVPRLGPSCSASRSGSGCRCRRARRSKR